VSKGIPALNFYSVCVSGEILGGEGENTWRTREKGKRGKRKRSGIPIPF